MTDELEKLSWLFDTNDVVLKKTNASKDLLSIVGPSGVGKTALARILEDYSSKFYVVPNVTTREKRSSDFEFHFEYVSESEFLKMLERGDFFAARVGGSPCYGYKKTDIKNALSNNRICVFMFRYSGLKFFSKNFKNFKTVYLTSKAEIISSRSLDAHKRQTKSLTIEMQTKSEEVVIGLEEKGLSVLRFTNNYSGEEELKGMASAIIRQFYDH
ncbi:MAG: hypothetical protein HWE24_15545 [Oceanospirillaceae bacterium]|nr:hypothetical protein [Oceanospirillaceae bacterium]